MERATEHDPREPDTEHADAQGEDAGLSLSQLSTSFAKLFGQGSRSATKADVGQSDKPKASAATESLADECGLLVDPPTTDGCSVSPKSILEAILFIGHPKNEPLPSQQIASLMRGVEPAELEQLVVELNTDYDQQRSAYEIESLSGGYRMALRTDLQGLRERFYGRIREIRLSQTAIDVLAVVAYSQPISRREIDKLRGRPCGAVLTQLVRRQLLRIHRDEQRTRHILYHTTDRFLQLFGLDSLEELPRSQASLE